MLCYYNYYILSLFTFLSRESTARVLFNGFHRNFGESALINIFHRAGLGSASLLHKVRFHKSVQVSVQNSLSISS